MTATLPDDPTELYSWASNLVNNAPAGVDLDEDHPLQQFANGLLMKTVDEYGGLLDHEYNEALANTDGLIDYDHLRIAEADVALEQHYAAGFGQVVSSTLTAGYETPAQIDPRTTSPRDLPQMQPGAEAAGMARVELQAKHTFTSDQLLVEGTVFAFPI